MAIKFLVICIFCMLLAVTSYPFVYQRHLLLGTAFILLGFIGLILWVIIGANRDEFISRISGTTPNRLSFTGTFGAHVIAYVVPLAGMLAAVSFDASDVLRSLVAPIVHLFSN